MYYAEPPEAQSIKSMFHIVRILAIIFGVLLFLAGLAYVGLIVAAYNACQVTFGGCYGVYGGALGYLLIWPIIIVIFGLIDIVIYVKMKSLEALVNNRQYEQAKSQTLIWMILGFILGGIIIGILLLVAYLKFDPLINAARAQGGQGQWAQPGQPGQPSWGQPAPATWGQPTAPPPAGKTCAACGAPNAVGAQFCAKCGAAMPP